MKESSILHLTTLFERYPELRELKDAIVSSSELICDAHSSGGKILVCGNGGSAADSEHIVGELMKGFVLPRKLTDDAMAKLSNAGYDDWNELGNGLQRGVAAVALTGHISLSTAVLNDNNPYMIFAQQVYALGRPGDLLIGLSTSGESKNVLNAVKVASVFGLAAVGFTGANPCSLDGLCDIVIKAPETETYRIQELHQPIYHTICLMVEEELFGVQ